MQNPRERVAGYYRNRLIFTQAPDEEERKLRGARRMLRA